MQPIIDYARPATHRARRPWRKILLVIVAIAAIPIALFAGFAAWWNHEMTRNEVVIMVDNQASVPVDAMLFDIAVKSVAPGKKADAGKNTYRSMGAGPFRVRVGTRNYEGDAGILLDDDGPHRFWVKAFDDRVVVTRQSTKGHGTLICANSASQPGPRNRTRPRRAGRQ
jgi:hypothetical protein